MFSSKISTAFNPNGEMFERIEFNGTTTYITVGQLEREYSKADKNYMPILLYAISKATTSTNINLCLLLPVNQLPKKERMIQELKGKSFDFKVKDSTRKVFIHNVAILPEGYVSYYSIDNTENDAAIIYTPYGDYIFCILSTDLSDTGSAVDHIHEITTMVYDWFTSPIMEVDSDTLLPLGTSETEAS